MSIAMPQAFVEAEEFGVVILSQSHLHLDCALVRMRRRGEVTQRDRPLFLAGR
uniref:Uncharacterized protein n=1 Tax=Pseudomonas aeruginosa TaxID=287 RepID=A0A2L1KDZ8_PSEAI|nr:Hypothetical protein [Pseudomonas aeruginosa]